MQFIKGFSEFINEGAWVDPNDSSKVIISNSNTTSNKDEVLKTTDGSTGIDISLSPFPVYWGLTYKEYTGIIDHEGRFKYTMDLLKKAESRDKESIIYDEDGNSGEQAISNFISSNFKNLNISPPDYICAIGSTEGLAGMLGRSINSIYPNAKVVGLNKVVYVNAVDAFDFAEFKNQVERQLKEKPNSNTFSSISSSLVSTYINRKATDAIDPQIMIDIKAARNPDEFEKALFANIKNIQFKEQDADLKKLVPFIVRSTRRDFGGGRDFWKSKYNYQEQEFLDGVHDCILNNKKMIIVDDNKNSGEDIITISEAIVNIAKGIMKVNDGSNLLDKIRSLFSFYLMYDMHHAVQSNRINSKKAHYNYTSPGQPIYSAKLSTDVLKSFEDYLRLSPEERDEFLKNNRSLANASYYIKSKNEEFASLLFSQTLIHFNYLLTMTRLKRKEVLNYGDVFQKAWEDIINREEYSNEKKKELGKIFILLAKKKKWQFLNVIGLEKLQAIVSQ